MPEGVAVGRRRACGVAFGAALGALAALAMLDAPAAGAMLPGMRWASSVRLGAGSGAATEAPLADAAMRRDSARVRLLLKQGADVNASQGDGMTALHWAALHGDAAQAGMLVTAGARLDVRTRNGSYTPLHLASRGGRAAAVVALLDAGADANAGTASGGATALHLAAGNGDTAVIAALLAHGARIDAREANFGQTPLMWAAAAGRVPAMRVLLGGGADLKATSTVTDMAAQEKAWGAALAARNKRMAAMRAAEQPPKPVADTAARAVTPNAGSGAAAAEVPKETAPAGARADSAQARALTYGQLVGNSGGLTPLLFAVRQGHADAVDALLAAGADVNQVSAGDHTSPLLMATINGHFDLAKHLLEKGADPKLASDAGTTPLYATINVQWAAKSLYPQPTAQYQQQLTYLELMEALIKAGADVNARLSKHLWFMSFNFDLLGVNTEGATPFWRAAYGLDIPAMKLLLAHGADPKVPTRKPAGRQRGIGGGPPKDESGLPPIPVGGPGVYAIHAASGVGYGEGFAANSHRHAPDAWIPAVRFLVEELGADVNARDHNGYTPLHHAAARGDNALIEYLVSKGADIRAVSRGGQTVADMANGPVQRIPPFPETVALAEKLGSKNNHKCQSC